MAKGILVSYAGYPYCLSSLFPDNGLASLVAVLRQNGHECTVLDYNTVGLVDRLVSPDCRAKLEGLLPRIQGELTPDLARELSAAAAMIDHQAIRVVADLGADLVQRCKRERLDFVGFKVWSGDGFEGFLSLSRRLREACPAVKIFAGGPAVHFSGHVVAELAPDVAVVDGDGEEALLQLVRNIEGRAKPVPNLITKDEQVQRTFVDLQSLPTPSYDPEAYPAVRNEKIRLFCIDDSRGCPVGCAFCANWCIQGRTWRTRSVERLVEEIRSLRECFGSRSFRLAGTHTPPTLLKELCEQLIEQQLDVQFGLFIHTRSLTAELVDLMRRAGCFGAFIGIESGSDTILRDVMHKTVDSHTIKRGLQLCLDAGLFTAGSLIFPTPLQTAETERQTKDFIEEVFLGRKNGVVNVCYPALIPDTLWWKDRRRYGFTLDTDEVTYRKAMLQLKIRHIVPTTLWEELPYHLHGQRQTELARTNSEFQRWLRQRGLGVNIGDHDAQVGSLLGYTPAEFSDEMRRILFTGDAEGLAGVVQQANAAVAPCTL